MSRRFHFWNTDIEDAEHTYEGLIRNFSALQHFRGRGTALDRLRLAASRLRDVQLLGHEKHVHPWTRMMLTLLWESADPPLRGF